MSAENSNPKPEEAPSREISTEYDYAIDVAPIMYISPLVPKLPPGMCFWLGFQWQANIGKWLVHCGRRAEFRLLKPKLVRQLFHEAVQLNLIVTAYYPRKPLKSV